MKDLDEELWKLGILAKTKHNEVAPCQHEMAPIFSTTNIATDHNQLTMEVMQQGRSEARLGLPAAREAVRGRQRLRQAQQLVYFHRYRREPARAGQDPGRERTVPAVPDRSRSRLWTSIRICSASRSPPRATITVWARTRRLRPSSPCSWATSCTAILEAHRDRRGLRRTGDKTEMNLGVSCAAARSRRIPPTATAPLPSPSPATSLSSASLGSSRQHCLREHHAEHRQSRRSCASSPTSWRAPRTSKQRSMTLIKREIKAHKRIIFNGNGYDESWVVEAEKRGLLNLKTTADAFPHYVDQKNLDLFAKHNVYTAAEMQLPYGDPARGVQQDPAHRGSDHERHGTRGDHCRRASPSRASLQPPSTARRLPAYPAAWRPAC